MDTLERIAEILGVDLLELFGSQNSTDVVDPEALLVVEKGVDGYRVLVPFHSNRKVLEEALKAAARVFHFAKDPAFIHPGCRYALVELPVEEKTGAPQQVAPSDWETGPASCLSTGAGAASHSAEDIVSTLIRNRNKQMPGQ